MKKDIKLETFMLYQPIRQGLYRARFDVDSERLCATGEAEGTIVALIRSNSVNEVVVRTARKQAQNVVVEYQFLSANDAYRLANIELRLLSWAVKVSVDPPRPIDVQHLLYVGRKLSDSAYLRQAHQNDLKLVKAMFEKLAKGEKRTVVERLHTLASIS